MSRDVASRRPRVRMSLFVVLLTASIAAGCMSDGMVAVDADLTASAVLRADGADEIRTRPSDLRRDALQIEWEELDDLFDEAQARDRRLDARAVARAWLAQTDGVEVIAEFVDAAIDDSDVDRATADRYVMVVSVLAALSQTVRDELVVLFERSLSVEEFEVWVRSLESPAALPISTGLLDVGDG